MACSGWLLAMGSCCLILVAQVNAETTQEPAPSEDVSSTNVSSTIQTSTPPLTSSSTASTTTLNVSVKAAAAGGTTATPATATTPAATTPTAATTPAPTHTSSAAAAAASTPAAAAATTAGATSAPTQTSAAAAAVTTSTPAAAATTSTITPASTTPPPAATTTPTAAAATTPAATPSTTQNSTMTSTAIPSNNSSTKITSPTAVSANASSVTVSKVTTPSSTVTTESQGSTGAQSTSTQSTTTASHAPSTVLPQKPNLLINEFSYNDLFSNGSTFNIEIRRVDGEVAPKMVVMVSDLDMVCAAVVQIDSAAWKDNLAYKAATLTPANRRSVIVSLYTSVNWTSCADVKMSGVVPVDATIVSQDPVKTVTSHIPFVSDYLSRILIAEVNKSSTGQANVSVVRCEDTRLDPGSFIIAVSTFNKSNNCDLDPAATLKTVTLNYTSCSTWKDASTRKLINYFVEKVGEKYQCGFSPFYIQNATINCTKGTTMQWYIAGKFEIQYDNVVNETTCMNDITPGKLCLVTACHNCIISTKVQPSKGDISVTVGVVIACIAIFLIIVAIVILYIRKKRRGILQFRMTRLDDDDDDLIMTNDTDDFVGGQEASFSNSSYTRFK